MPDDTAHRLDDLEGQMIAIRSRLDRAEDMQQSDRLLTGGMFSRIDEKLDGMASTLGASPTTAPKSDGSGLCKQLSDLQAIEDEKKADKIRTQRMLRWVGAAFGGGVALAGAVKLGLELFRH